MKKVLSTLLCAALVIVVPGCGGNPKPPASGQKGQLIVRIPIPAPLRQTVRATRQMRQATSVSKIAVTVQKSGAASQTQEVTPSGETAEVAFSSLEVGSYTVTVQAKDPEDYVTYEGTGDATVSVNATTTVTVTLALKRAALQVSVTIPQGIGVASGTVTLDNLQGTTLTQDLSISGSTGTATFADLLPGIWPVSVVLRDAGGTKVAEGAGSVDVLPGRTNTASITIDASGTLSVQVSWNVPPPSPSNLSARKGTGIDEGGVVLTWAASPGGSGYSVHRATSVTGSKQLVSPSLVTELTFSDMTVTSGKTYFYWVVAHGSDGLTSDYSSPAAITLPASVDPTVTLVTDRNFRQPPVAVTLAATTQGLDLASSVYDWDFGDGTLRSAGHSSETHTFTTIGTYLPKVTVTDGNGKSAVGSVPVTVIGAVKTLSTTTTVYDVLARGDRLYTAQGTAGLVVYDVSTPAQATLLTSDSAATGGGTLSLVRLESEGDYLYAISALSGNYYLSIYEMNVSGVNPVCTLFALGYLSDYDLAVTADYVYFLGGGKLKVIDATNKAQPMVVGTIDAASSGSRIAATGNTLYIASSTSTATLARYDITNPASPLLLDSSPSYIFPKSLAAAEGHVYVIGDTNLWAYDGIGTKLFDSGSYKGNDLYVEGNYLYTLTSSGSSVLYLLDVSDAARPAEKGSVSSSYSATRLAVGNKHVYLAGNASGAGRIGIIYVGP